MIFILPILQCVPLVNFVGVKAYLFLSCNLFVFADLGMLNAMTTITLVISNNKK